MGVFIWSSSVSSRQKVVSSSQVILITTNNIFDSSASRFRESEALATLFCFSFQPIYAEVFIKQNWKIYPFFYFYCSKFWFWFSDLYLYIILHLTQFPTGVKFISLKILYSLLSLCLTIWKSLICYVKLKWKHETTILLLKTDW